MCRKEKYQTRLIHDGANIHLHHAAVRIQANWRGYVLRCWYKKLRDTIAPKDPCLRRVFFEKKLTDLTESMLYSFEKQECEIDRLIDATNDNLAYSKTVLRQLERCPADHIVDWADVKIKAGQHEIFECPICMMTLQDATGKVKRPIVLLSCSHVYHTVCLQMYEDCYPSGRHQCPMCRAYYLKRNYPEDI